MEGEGDVLRDSALETLLEIRPPSPAVSTDNFPGTVKPEPKCESPENPQQDSWHPPDEEHVNITDVDMDQHPIVMSEAISEDFEEEASMEGEDEDSREPLSLELEQGFRILKEIMSDANKSVNWPFMDPVDADKLGLYDYYEKINHPMWLKRMHEKFENREYTTITEYVRDMRLMLENCYRYNGPDHYVSKRGQRLETVMEQKLTLLSRDLREKTSIAATSGQPLEEKQITGTRRRKILVPNDSSNLLNQLRYEEQQREKEARRQVMDDRRKAQEAFMNDLQGWEETLFPGNLRQQMKSMWELPQIGHFLFVCAGVLNLGEVMHWELERSFALPRESSTMQLVMTSLLSTPYQRTKLDTKPLMPYKVWEERLRIRVRTWYKVLQESKGDLQKTILKLGLEEKFFKVVGMTNPLERRKYHELTFYQRVWLLKGLCDWCLEQQESIREAMELLPAQELNTYVLGEDGDGNTYMHFPQFCGQDLRIYRQSPIEYPTLDIEMPSPQRPRERRKQKSRSSAKKQKKAKEKATPKAPTPPPAEANTRWRDSRLRQNPRQVALRAAAAEEENSSETCDNSDSGISGSESDSDEPPEKVSRANGLSPRQLSRILDEESDQSRDSSPTRGLRSRRGNASRSPSADSTPSRTSRSSVATKDADSRSSTPIDYAKYRSRSRQSKRLLRSLQCNGGANDKELQQDKDGEETSGAEQEEAGDEDTQKCQPPSPGKPDDETALKGGTYEGSTCDDESNSNVVKSEAVIREKDDEATEGSDMDTSKVNGQQCDTELAEESLKNSSNGDCDELETQSKKPALPFSTYTDAENANSVITDVDTVCNKLSGVKQEGDSAETSQDIVKPESLCKDDTSSDMSLVKTESDPKDDPNCSITEKSSSVDTEKYSDAITDICQGEQRVTPPSDTEAAQSSITQIKSAGGGEASETMDITEDKCVNMVPIKSEDLAQNETVDELNNCKDIASVEEQPQSDGLEEVKSEICDNDKDSSILDEASSVSVKTEPVEDSKPATPPVPEEPEIPPEITEPDLKDFMMVGECVEDLRRLVERFAEIEPIVETTRGNKQKVIKATRKQCETELHERLVFLYNELEPWESKLVAANKRACLKLRKEQDSYVEEPEPKEDVWESEESASEDSDSNEDESGEEPEKETKAVTSAHSKSRSKAPHPVVSEALTTEASDLEIIENMSQRGRIRKRRIIPNNIEETFPRKRVKVEDEVKRASPSPKPSSSSSPPNILASSRRAKPAVANRMTSMSMSMVNGRPTLMMPPGQQPLLLRLPNGQQIQLVAQLPGHLQAKTNTSQQPPVLAIKNSSASGVTQLLSFVNPMKLQAQSKDASGGGDGMSESSVAQKNVPFCTKNNVSQLPPAVLKDLLKVHGLPIKKGRPHKITVATAAIQKDAGDAEEVNPERSENQTGVTEVSTSNSAAASTASLLYPRPGSSTSSAPIRLVAPVQKAAATISPSQISPGLLAYVKKHGTGIVGGSPITEVMQANPGLLQVLSSPTKPLGRQRYAGNVTVKSLLEDRAARLHTQTAPDDSGEGSSEGKDPVEQHTETAAEDSVEEVKDIPEGSQPAVAPLSTDISGTDTEDSQARSEDIDSEVSTEPDQSLSIEVNQQHAASSAGLVLGVAGSSAAALSAALVMDTAASDRLSSIVRAVVTEAPTSLPTAQFKVESPFGMPAIQSHRPVTMTTASMKSPIPSVPPIETDTPKNIDPVASSVLHTTSSPNAPGPITIPAAGQSSIPQASGQGAPQLVLPPAAIQALLSPAKLATQTGAPNTLTGQQLLQAVLAQQGAVQSRGTPQLLQNATNLPAVTGKPVLLSNSGVSAQPLLHSGINTVGSSPSVSQTVLSLPGQNVVSVAGTQAALRTVSMSQGAAPVQLGLAGQVNMLPQGAAAATALPLQLGAVNVQMNAGGMLQGASGAQLTASLGPTGNLLLPSNMVLPQQLLQQPQSSGAGTVAMQTMLMQTNQGTLQLVQVPMVNGQPILPQQLAQQPAPATLTTPQQAASATLATPQQAVSATLATAQQAASATLATPQQAALATLTTSQLATPVALTTSQLATPVALTTSQLLPASQLAASVMATPSSVAMRAPASSLQPSQPTQFGCVSSDVFAGRTPIGQDVGTVRLSSTSSEMQNVSSVGALDLLSSAALGLTSSASAGKDHGPVSTLNVSAATLASHIGESVPPAGMMSVPRSSVQVAATQPATLQANVAAPVLPTHAPAPSTSKGVTPPSGQKTGNTVHMLQLSTGTSGRPLQVQVAVPPGVSLQQLLKSPQLQKQLASLVGGGKPLKIAANITTAPKVSSTGLPASPVQPVQQVSQQTAVSAVSRQLFTGSSSQTVSGQVMQQVAGSVAGGGVMTQLPQSHLVATTVTRMQTALAPAFTHAQKAAAVNLQPHSTSPMILQGQRVPALQPQALSTAAQVQPSAVNLLKQTATPMPAQVQKVGAMKLPVGASSTLQGQAALAPRPVGPSTPAIQPQMQLMAPAQATTVKPPAKPAQVQPSPNKLVLYNIGGQLMTGQGVPVTVRDGVVHVSVKADPQVIANNLAALQQASINTNTNSAPNLQRLQPGKTQSLPTTATQPLTPKLQTNSIAQSSVPQQPAAVIPPSMQTQPSQPAVATVAMHTLPQVMAASLNNTSTTPASQAPS